MTNDAAHAGGNFRFLSRRTFVLFLIIILPTCFLAYLLISAITDIRFLELRNNLHSISDKNDELRALTIVSRFKNLAAERVSLFSSAEDLRREQELMILASSSQTRRELSGVRLYAGLVVVNWINFLMGWPTVALNRESPSEKFTDIGYYQERRRNFRAAVTAYEKALIFVHDPDTAGYIGMHVAYSQVMLNDYKKALETLRKIQKSGAARNALLAAGELEKIVTELANRAAMAERYSDPVEKAEYMFRIGAYQTALDILTQSGGMQGERADFLRARALEETGNSDKALEIYRSAILKNPQSSMAVQSNRRLYALGAFYGQGKEVREESKRNSESVVPDSVLRDEIRKSEAIVEKLENRSSDEKIVRIILESRQPNPEPPGTAQPAAQPAVQSQDHRPAPALPQQPAPVRQAPPQEKTPAPARKFNLLRPSDLEAAGNLSREEKQQLLASNYRQLDRILTEDGNEFFGVITSERKEHIIIFTLAGNLKIPTDQIAQRGKITTKSILQ